MIRASKMRNGVTTSIAAHIGVVLLAQFGLPQLFTDQQVSVDIIPVELVKLDSVNVPISKKVPDKKPKMKKDTSIRPKTEEPKIVKKPVLNKNKPDTSLQEKAVKKAVIQSPPPPKLKPKPPKELKRKKPEPAAKTQAKPRLKPKPPKSETNQRDFASILKDLPVSKDTSKDNSRNNKKILRDLASIVKDLPPATRSIDKDNVSRTPSITELERIRQILRRQLKECWNPPAGAKLAEKLIVTASIELDRKGYITYVKSKTMGDYSSHSKAAEEAAIRALRNPRCQPFVLPQDLYKYWRKIEFKFDPKEMLG